MIEMKDIVYGFFAARRYWTDSNALDHAYRELTKRLKCPEDSSVLIKDDEDVLPEGRCLIVIPMSGAVQRNILNACEQFEQVVLYAAYIHQNAPDLIADEMLRCNAAPTVMDCWGVLRRTHPHAELVLNEEKLEEAKSLLKAYSAIRNAKLLQVGVTEPWVVSNSKSLASYEARFGLVIQHVEQSELAELYIECSDEDAFPYMEHFHSGVKTIVEPSESDLQNAAKMTCALLRLMERHHAQGVALACFNLLKLGTTSCLGVSYINECTDMVAACECDMDSAITMLLMKQLTKSRLWMANPGLQPDGSINFSHCTAPIRVHDGDPLCYTLRSHHESGIGVALQVDLPIGQVVTSCRISDEAQSMTVHRGLTIEGIYEPTCRTQVHIRLEDPEHYIRTALGCHQVFAFDDITESIDKLAKMFGIQIL